MSATLEIVDISQRHLSSEEFQERLCSVNGPVAFVGQKGIAPDDLRAVTSNETDVVVYITDASAGTAGRGAADLVGTLWQSYPRVAALMSHRLPNAGAVVFSLAASQKIISTTDTSVDPVAAAVADLVRIGGSIRAVLVPEGGTANPALEPAPLSPNRPLSHASLLQSIFEHAEGPIWADLSQSADVAALKAGLLIWFDALDEGHEYCQSVEGKGKSRAADYWHAILHRREPDYSNAKYWFRRVGYQPVFDALTSRMGPLIAQSERAQQELGSKLTRDGRWRPDRFIDACQSASGSDAETELILRRIQADEMVLLLWQTCRDVFES